MTDVLIVSPFRRPTFRKAISSAYPVREPWDSAPLTIAGGVQAAGLAVDYLALQNLFDAWQEGKDLPVLRQILDEVPARMVIFAADYFVPSRSTATVFGMRIIGDELKRRDPKVVIGATGRLPTVLGGRLFTEVPALDFLVSGEADTVIGDIAGEVLLKGVEGARHPSLITRSPDGREAIAVATATNLDDMPMPAWHLLERSLRWDEQTRTVPGRVPFSLRTSAGCKFRCKFCAGVPNWLNYRMKSAERVAAETDTLLDVVGERGYLSFLEDEVFTRQPDHARAVSKVFADRNIRLDGVYTHSSMLDEDTAGDVAKMAGRVFLGLDNANDSILRDMRKGQRFAHVIEAVEIARKAGLSTHLEWIIGSPAEPLDSLSTSLNAIVTLLSTGVVDSINTYVYCPHPGTEYAEHANDLGMEILTGLDGIQESGGYPSYRTPHLSSQQIFVAYLMSQLVIAETLQHRSGSGPTTSVGTPNRDELRSLFGRFEGLR
ncbi:B12-binding domain-containing radical SAM protein [Kribbella monticola]|uniref:B12-binding domain-containing radical SAM protein n=1 Tax=Kribbella monticola TaxID=2185285 RepID=UPI000DD3E379|nr:radical SAM protein [Kribbella monticola]